MYRLQNDMFSVLLGEGGRAMGTFPYIVFLIFPLFVIIILVFVMFFSFLRYGLCKIGDAH